MLLGIAFLLIWLFALTRFPRVMLPATGVLVCIALLLAAAASIWQWRHERQVDQLQISIRYAPEACDFGKPLQVSIDNNADRTTEHIRWQLKAVQPGYNTNLLDIGVTANTYERDLTLQPGEQWQTCQVVPRLRSGYRAADLNYHAEQVRVQFQR